MLRALKHRLHFGDDVIFFRILSLLLSLRAAVRPFCVRSFLSSSFRFHFWSIWQICRYICGRDAWHTAADISFFHGRSESLNSEIPNVPNVQMQHSVWLVTPSGRSYIFPTLCVVFSSFSLKFSRCKYKSMYRICIPHIDHLLCDIQHTPSAQEEINVSGHIKHLFFKP